MKLGFLRSKVTREQVEKEAAEEFEAAIARAKPPTGERTWARDETRGQRATETSPVDDVVEEAPAAEAPEASEYGPGVVVEDEPYGPGVVVEDEPLGADSATHYGPGVVLEDEPLTAREELNGGDTLEAEPEPVVEPAPARRPRTAPSRARTATSTKATRSTTRSKPASTRSKSAGGGQTTRKPPARARQS